jgi:hypothetical protein
MCWLIIATTTDVVVVTDYSATDDTQISAPKLSRGSVEKKGRSETRPDRPGPTSLIPTT